MAQRGLDDLLNQLTPQEKKALKRLTRSPSTSNWKQSTVLQGEVTYSDVASAGASPIENTDLTETTQVNSDVKNTEVGLNESEVAIHDSVESEQRVRNNTPVTDSTGTSDSDSGDSDSSDSESDMAASILYIPPQSA